MSSRRLLPLENMVPGGPRRYSHRVMAGKHGRGKIVAWTGLSLTLGLLGALVLVYHQALFEAWHLHKLEKGSTGEKLAALEKLIELRSRRVASRIIDWTVTGGNLAQEAKDAILKLGEEAIPALLGVVRNRFETEVRDQREIEMIRYNAAVLVVKIRGETPETLLLLVNGFDGGTASALQGPIAHLLQKCKDLKGSGLLAAISRKPSVLRSRLLQLCARHDGLSEGVRTAIFGLLEADPEAEIRLQAALALAEYPDPAAREAVPALERLLGDPEDGVRAAAASALAKVSPRSLIEAAAHADAAVRLAAIGAFGDQHGEEGAQ
ncbi:MAG: HEAT repeat domain-containing protein, partial [Thermoanaerobaculia bacterium]